MNNDNTIVLPLITQEAEDEDDAPTEVATSDEESECGETRRVANKRDFIQLTAGPPERGNDFCLPDLEPGQKWRWEPTGNRRIVVMKDAALAASNAISTVWEGKEVLVGMCSYHASARWIDAGNGKKYLKKKENRKKILMDFQAFKNCPHEHLVEIYQQAMVDKWSKVHGEKKFAEEWMASWGEQIVTRIQLNARNPLMSGFPSNNNCVEVGNKDDKDFSTVGW